MKKYFILFMVFFSEISFSFPISFSRNQGDLEYDETMSDHFYFYHDKDSPQEADFLLKSLELARPSLDSWFGVDTSKDSFLALSSSVTHGASFANFFGNTLELQTLGQGTRDLALHELTHMLMYRKFEYPFLNLFLGHGSSLLELIWTPVWFIEGLAEAFARSSGSHYMASLERYHALSGNWPNYDRLHSLYDGDKFARRGYATSGTFVTWLLKNREEYFISFLEELKRYSLPWFYLGSFNPFSRFLPMDSALERSFGKNGRELYEDYKKEMTKFWREKRGTFLFSEEEAEKALLKSYRTVFTNGNRAYIVAESEGKIQKHKLVFDKKTGWMIALRPYGPIYEDWFKDSTFLETSSDPLVVHYGKDFKYGTTTHEIVSLKRVGDERAFFQRGRVLYRPSGLISEMHQNKESLIWLELDKEKSKLCILFKKDLKKEGSFEGASENCFLEKSYPETLEILGSIPEDSQESTSNVKSLFLKTKTQKVYEDSSEIYRFDLKSKKMTRFEYSLGGDVKKILPFKKGFLLLVSSLSENLIVYLNSNGSCQSSYELNDYLLDLDLLEDESLILSLYKDDKKVLKKIHLSSLQKKSCSYFRAQTSPLVESIKNFLLGDKLSLKEALDKASFYRGDRISSPAKKKVKEEDLKEHSILKKKRKKSPSHFRGRSLFYLPTVIDSSYPYEPGLGVFSVPFMDHLQNHEVWLSAFWNFRSTPNVHLNYKMTRFWPSFGLDLYRKVLWNGYEIDTAEKEGKEFLYKKVSYVSELGGDGYVNWKFYTKKTKTFLTANLKIVKRGDLTTVKPVEKTIEGLMLKPSLSLSQLIQFDSLSFVWGLKASYATPFLGSVFDYNTLSANLLLRKKFDWRKSSLSFALSGGRVRGKSGKIPLLRQYYTPLKTYIPSGGGGFNDTNYRLLGPSGLFSPLLGDDKVRAEIKWKVPLISRIDRLWWILFLRSLDFTSTWNYGGIWSENDFDWKKLSFSHGYNLDLHLGNKGVNLYTGLGIGQKIDMKLGTPQVSLPSLYFRFGFRALL